LDKNIDTRSFLTEGTGDHEEEIRIRRVIKFERYEIEIELEQSGVFLNILSVKVSKDFAESIKSTTNPVVHDVEKYYRED
jgi:hypothetical protein